MAANVPGGGSEVCGDGLGGAFTPEACGFDLDAEGLVFHGEAPFGPGLWGCAPALRRDTFIALFAGNSNG